MEQVFEFQKAGIIHYKNSFRDFAIAMKMATAAKDKDFKKYINEPLQIEKVKKRIPNKKEASKLKRAFQWLLKKK